MSVHQDYRSAWRVILAGLVSPDADFRAAAGAEIIRSQDRLPNGVLWPDSDMVSCGPIGYLSVPVLVILAEYADHRITVTELAYRLGRMIDAEYEVSREPPPEEASGGSGLDSGFVD